MSTHIHIMAWHRNSKAEAVTIYSLAGFLVIGGFAWLTALPVQYSTSKGIFVLVLAAPLAMAYIWQSCLWRFTDRAGLPKFEGSWHILGYLGWSPFYVAVARWSIAISLGNYLVMYRPFVPQPASSMLHNAFIFSFIMMNVLYAVACNVPPGIVAAAGERESIDASSLAEEGRTRGSGMCGRAIRLGHSVRNTARYATYASTNSTTTVLFSTHVSAGETTDCLSHSPSR